MKKPRSTSKSREEDNRFALIIGLILLLIFAFVMGFIYWLVTPVEISPVVVSEIDAGHVLQASFSHIAFPDETRTTIETDKGNFLVSGAFTALKGHALVLETRQNGFRMLCDRVEKRCLPLVW